MELLLLVGVGAGLVVMTVQPEMPIRIPYVGLMWLIVTGVYLAMLSLKLIRVVRQAVDRR